MSARSDFGKNNDFKFFKHVEIFPALRASERVIHIRSMLFEYKFKLLKLASETKAKLG